MYQVRIGIKYALLFSSCDIMISTEKIFMNELTHERVPFWFLALDQRGSRVSCYYCRVMLTGYRHQNQRPPGRNKNNNERRLEKSKMKQVGL